MAYFDENGNEVQGLMTEEEVNARVEQTQKELQEEFSSKEAESQQKIGELNAKIEQLGTSIKTEEGGNNSDKDANLAALRQQKKAAEDAVAAEKAKSEERIQALERRSIDAVIRDVAGDNPELREKVWKHYSETLGSMPASTDEEIRAKVDAAYRLSGDTANTPSALDSALGGGSRGADINSGAVNTVRPFTDNEKALGAAMGITDADREKYGPRLRQK